MVYSGSGTGSVFTRIPAADRVIVKVVLLQK